MTDTKCTHLNCLVYHPDGKCGCDMKRYCHQCQQKPSGDVTLVKDINHLIQKSREEAAKEARERTIEEIKEGIKRVRNCVDVDSYLNTLNNYIEI